MVDLAAVPHPVRLVERSSRRLPRLGASGGVAASVLSVGLHRWPKRWPMWEPQTREPARASGKMEATL